MTPREIICVPRQDLCFHAMEGRVFAQKRLLKNRNMMAKRTARQKIESKLRTVKITYDKSYLVAFGRDY